MTSVVPMLKHLMTIDGRDFDSLWLSNDQPVSIGVRAMFGPRDGEGEESSDFWVCNAKGIEQRLSEGSFFARHHLIVDEFDPIKIRAMIHGLGMRCISESWKDAAEKLGGYGLWEFEGYEE